MSKQSIKYLEVLIDGGLNLKAYIDYMVKKARSVKNWVAWIMLHIGDPRQSRTILISRVSKDSNELRLSTCSLYSGEAALAYAALRTSNRIGQTSKLCERQVEIPTLPLCQHIDKQGPRKKSTHFLTGCNGNYLRRFGLDSSSWPKCGEEAQTTENV